MKSTGISLKNIASDNNSYDYFSLLNQMKNQRTAAIQEKRWYPKLFCNLGKFDVPIGDSRHQSNTYKQINICMPISYEINARRQPLKY